MTAQSQTESETQLKMDRILSLIAPDQWFLGSDVRDALQEIITIADESIAATSQKAADEAVKTAVVPLLADKAAEKTRADGWEAEYRKAETDRLAALQRAETAEKWAIAGWCAAGGAVIVEVIVIVIQMALK